MGRRDPAVAACQVAGPRNIHVQRGEGRNPFWQIQFHVCEVRSLYSGFNNFTTHAFPYALCLYPLPSILLINFLSIYTNQKIILLKIQNLQSEIPNRSALRPTPLLPFSVFSPSHLPTFCPSRYALCPTPSALIFSPCAFSYFPHSDIRLLSSAPCPTPSDL